jgi:hypothetical protein
MSIIDRLAKDLAQLLERELTRETANLDRLYLTLLLLIGWRRDSGKRYAAKPEPRPFEDFALEDVDDLDDHEEEENEEPATSNVSALQHLREQVNAFRQANPYLNGLLFRDYQGADACYEEYHLPGFGCVRLHPETCRYVEEVLLLRRLQPAKKIGKEPSNLHLLLQSLCRQSRAVGERVDDDVERIIRAWQSTEIQRRLDGGSHEEDWFRGVAAALREQHQRLGECISKTAYNRRVEYGPYWLQASVCAEKVGEELNLREVLEIIPVPLHASFSGTADFLRLLRAVVDSLNTRYRLLRGCGLPPEDWLHRDKPSIDHLKDLAKLRKLAVAGADWQEGRRQAAFERAFDVLLPECGGTVGGFETFAEWFASEVGETMYYRGLNRKSSLSELLDPGEGDDSADLDIADPSTDIEADIILHDTFAGLLEEAGPHLAGNPVLQAFFRWVLVEGREFADRDGLLQQPAFQALWAGDARYAALSTTDLSARLFTEARAVILEVLLETCPDAISPVLREYLHWVVIEEKPERGKDGLFNRKSFKTLLAKEAGLNILAPEQLSERLHGMAFDLMQTLFGRLGHPVE